MMFKDKQLAVLLGNKTRISTTRSTILCLFVFLFVILFQPAAIAILSAKTANVIYGHVPEIPAVTQTKLQDNLFLVIQDGDFSYRPKIEDNDTVNLSLSTTFKQISVDIDLDSFSDVDFSDPDGDIFSENDGFKLLSLTYQWKDKNGTIIENNSPNNLGGDICITPGSYLGPYSLAVKGIMQMTTEYGIPRQTTETFSKNYVVNANDGICFIRPANLALNISGGNPPSNPNSAGSTMINRNPSYDPETFKVQAGFFAWAEQKFPTMAFPRANFSIVPINSADQYNFELQENPNNALEVVSAGVYQFGTTKPGQGQDYVIKVTNKTTLLDFYYTFRLKSSRSWFTQSLEKSTSLGSSSAGLAETAYNKALTYCTDKGADLPTRIELTNSIYAPDTIYPPATLADYAKDNGFSRSIGESLSGEWGKLYYYAPVNGDLGVPAGDFAYWYYWTKDRAPNGIRYGVGIVEGNISIVKGAMYYFMCVE